MPSPLVSSARRLALLAGVALVALPAQAQDVVLDTVVVEGSGTGGSGTGPVEGYVARTTTSGAKTDTPVIEIPQAISVITTDQLADRGVQDLGEALRYTAGVIAEPAGSDPRFFGPTIRGFTSIYSVYLNNFRFSRDFGAIAFEPYGQERIEVIKGPASVLYGQDEPGGIVNLVQKRPTFTNFGEAGIEIGSDERYVAKTDLGGVSADGMASWRMTALGRLADDQMDFVTDDRFYVAPTITISPDADTSLTILSTVQYDEGTSRIGLPLSGTLESNANGRIPRSRYAGEPDFNDNESTLGTVGYEFRHRFNETFEVRQNLQYVNFDADYNNLYFFGLGADGRTATRGVSIQSEEYEGFGVDNQLESVFTTGLLEHTTLLGLDYRNNNQWRASNFPLNPESFTSIDIFNPVYGQPISIVDNTSFADTTLEQVGVYGQDQVQLGNLVGTFSVRHDWTENKNEITGDTRSYDEFTGRAGLVYLFDNGLAPYVSYSTSFNPTAGANEIQQLLEPTEGESIEGGVKFQPEGWDTLVTASVFEITRSNIPTNLGNNVIVQVGEARSRGFEIEAVATLADGLDLLGAYAYTDTEVTEDLNAASLGNRLIDTPNNAASLWLDYTLQSQMLGARFSWLEGVSVGGGVRYLGERFGDAANSIELPDVTLVDAAIRYERDNFEAALNVSNIADERYLSTCSAFGCYYGEGRTVLGSLTYKW